MNLDNFLPKTTDSESKMFVAPTTLTSKDTKFQTSVKCAVDCNCEGEVSIRKTDKGGVVMPLCAKHFERLVKLDYNINAFMAGD